jgi:hypothetical protein
LGNTGTQQQNPEPRDKRRKSILMLMFLLKIRLNTLV